jgi:hypothetical protein
MSPTKVLYQRFLLLIMYYIRILLNQETETVNTIAPHCLCFLPGDEKSRNEFVGKDVVDTIGLTY